MEDRTVAELYHKQGDMSLIRSVFTIPGPDEDRPKPKGIRVSAMNAEQLQEKTGCPISLSLCEIAVESGEQAQFLECQWPS